MSRGPFSESVRQEQATPLDALRRTVPTRKKPTYHHGNLKIALKRAALDLVDRHGPKGFTLKEAAQRAGVSVAAPYRHFEDREALLASLAEDGFRELGARLETVSRTASPPKTVLERLGRAYVRFAIDEPSLFRIMFWAELDKDRFSNLREVSVAAFDTLVRAVRQAQSAGVLAQPPRGSDPLAFSIVCWSVVHGMATLHVEGAFAHLEVADDIEKQAVAATRMLIEGSAAGG